MEPATTQKFESIEEFFENAFRLYIVKVPNSALHIINLLQQYGMISSNESCSRLIFRIISTTTKSGRLSLLLKCSVPQEIQSFCKDNIKLFLDKEVSHFAELPTFIVNIMHLRSLLSENTAKIDNEMLLEIMEMCKEGNLYLCHDTIFSTEDTENYKKLYSEIQNDYKAMLSGQ